MALGGREALVTKEFISAGPYEIPVEKNAKGTKLVTRDLAREFFEFDEGLGRGRGCYIFAIRNRGLRAVYVGKATKSFQQVVYFIVAPARLSADTIAETERYLIQVAKRAWPDMLNIHHSGAPDWEIRGVTSSHPGTKSDAAADLISMLKLS
jgi:hypothetical protein